MRPLRDESQSCSERWAEQRSVVLVKADRERRRDSALSLRALRMVARREWLAAQIRRSRRGSIETTELTAMNYSPHRPTRQFVDSSRPAADKSIADAGSYRATYLAMLPSKPRDGCDRANFLQKHNWVDDVPVFAYSWGASLAMANADKLIVLGSPNARCASASPTAGECLKPWPEQADARRMFPSGSA